MEALDQFWQSLHPALQTIIIGLIVAAFVGIISLVIRLIRRFTITSARKKATEEDRLKMHFQEINEEIRSDLSEANISEMYGLIVTYAGGVPQYHPDFVGIELPKLPDSFEVHFPKEKETYGNYIRKILKNNQDYKELRNKIKTDFESEGIPLVNINTPPTTSPVIYDSILWPLFNWWEDRSQGKVNPQPNFEQIETSPDFGHNHLLVVGWGSGAIAYAETEADKQRCKNIIGNIAENREYENKAATIIQSANNILEDFRTYKAALISTLDSTKKFWPGTKTYVFKKETKKCARCKEIFT